MDQSPLAARWTPAPFLLGSGALHLAAAAAVAIRPHWWPYALEAVLANHALLAAAGLWPRSTWLGSNWTRLPLAVAQKSCVALTIDDGPEPLVTPRVLDLLDEYGAKATFFGIGERVEQYPQLAREILHRGHALENHSHRHLHYFSLLGPRRMRQEIHRAQQAIGTITGQRPLFFRAPAGLRNPWLDPILSRLGLQLASWTRRGFDSVNSDVDSVFDRLARGLQAGDIFLLHDGHAARTRAGVPVIFAVLPRLLAALSAAGLKSITLREALA